jgi:hypothetical protein
MRPGIIYKITHRESGKAYIGLAAPRRYDEDQPTPEWLLTRRWGEHQEDAQNGCYLYFHRAIHNHGPASFDAEVIAECDDKWLDYLEKTYILIYNTFGEGGYNRTPGGRDYEYKDHRLKARKEEHPEPDLASKPFLFPVFHSRQLDWAGGASKQPSIYMGQSIIFANAIGDPLAQAIVADWQPRFNVRIVDSLSDLDTNR